jgi:hypothetical protein
MNYAILTFWLLIAWSVTATAETVLVLLLASLSFASLALIPLEVSGGISILPQSVFGLLLIVKVLGPQVLPLSSKLATALRLQNLGFLALFLLVSIVAALIMPRLFSEDVVIIPMRENSSSDLLRPIMANITQSGYVALSVLTVFAVTLIAGESGFLNTLRTAMLTGGFVCVVTGLVDVVASSTGMSALLEPFRNANYAFLTDVDISGVKRVVGLTPEASVYGPICVDFAAAIGLLRTLYPKGRERFLATVVAVSLVAMALLSTSSTAYGGLAVLVLAYTLNWIRRAFFSSPLGQREVVAELLVGLGAMIALLAVVLVHPSLFDPLLNLIDEIVLNKPLSSSFVERSHWNAVAWNTVASTWGLGVGLGSTRTSNWFAAIMSNTGLLGAAFMGTFLVQTFAKRANWQNPLTTELLGALKLSLLPALAMAAVDFPGPDFGLWIAVIFGAISGVGSLQPRRISAKQVRRGATLPTRGGQVLGQMMSPGSSPR